MHSWHINPANPLMLRRKIFRLHISKSMPLSSLNLPLCSLCEISFVSSVVNFFYHELHEQTRNKVAEASRFGDFHVENFFYHKGHKDFAQSSQCRGEKSFASRHFKIIDHTVSEISPFRIFNFTPL